MCKGCTSDSHVSTCLMSFCDSISDIVMNGCARPNLSWLFSVSYANLAAALARFWCMYPPAPRVAFLTLYTKLRHALILHVLLLDVKAQPGMVFARIFVLHSCGGCSWSPNSSQLIAGFPECTLQLSTGAAVMPAALCSHLCGFQEGLAGQHCRHDPLLIRQVTTQSPLSHHSVTIQSPLSHHSVTTQSSLSHHSVITQSALSHDSVTTQLPLSHHSVTTQSGLSCHG